MLNLNPVPVLKRYGWYLFKYHDKKEKKCKFIWVFGLFLYCILSVFLTCVIIYINYN